ncbi:Glutathione synthetase large chain [Lachnellula suecica]|uniref:Glutathione synthetase n=1 Tax=Lachnellula suecica TaxID=602035 RepID=A0A8T9C826_9HELO|nr:Glutathione synthetase large chain [Lachnellula suecica]
MTSQAWKEFPPPLSDEQLEILVANIKDWQLTHGSLLKLVSSDEDSTVLAQPVGACLFPTLFPRQLFEQALDLQKTYDKLYARVAEDEEWLYSTLKGLIETYDLARVLWGIHQEVEREGYVQDVVLGIFRSDYMLDANTESVSTSEEILLKQVEFNTISCAGGVHSNLVADMHRRLQRSGAYLPSDPNLETINISSSSLPPSHTLSTLTTGLVAAHNLYGPPKSPNANQTCILFIVQPRNFNIADERPIEYALWDQDIPAYRVIFAEEVLAHTSLSPGRELLYHPPSRAGPMEVSVVYFRAAFEADEFDDNGRKARLLLERSRAIKCPSILSHLTTFKKVQQALALPGGLRRFLTEDEAVRIASTFAPIYPMDESEIGMAARKLALSSISSKSYILKPSLEGGGHNIYGEDIPRFLSRTPKNKWSNYILMEKITSPAIHNLSMSPRGFYRGPVVSELGIFGICLWKRDENTEGRVEITQDLNPCWSFKTKSASVNEMSVVKGYGCFDSPALVDQSIFSACCLGTVKAVEHSGRRSL